LHHEFNLCLTFELLGMLKLMALGESQSTMATGMFDKDASTTESAR